MFLNCNLDSYLQLVTGRDGEFSTPTSGKIDAMVCLSFSYYLFGNGNASTSVVLGRDSTETLLFTRDQNHENFDKWHRFEEILPLTSGYYTLRFLAKSGFGTSVAFDAIKMTNGQCKLPARYYCDFDGAFLDGVECLWLQFNNGQDWKWKVITADDVPTIKTDHSSRTGLGKVLAAGDERAFDRAAIGDEISFNLISADENEGVQCFSFWYFFTKGDLRVDYIYTDAASMEKSSTIWNADGEVSNGQWAYYQTDLNPSQGIYKLMIVFNKTENAEPVFFDSISIAPGKCGPAATCDFNSNLCGFSNSEKTSSKFLLGSGRLADPSKLGPDFERPGTVPKERYVYIDSTGSNEDQRFVLTSDQFTHGEDEGTYCLSFKYFLYGTFSEFRVRAQGALTSPFGSHFTFTTLYEEPSATFLTHLKPLSSSKWNDMELEYHFDNKHRLNQDKVQKAIEFSVTSDKDKTFFAIDDVGLRWYWLLSINTCF